MREEQSRTLQTSGLSLTIAYSVEQRRHVFHGYDIKISPFGSSSVIGILAVLTFYRNYVTNKVEKSFSFKMLPQDSTFTGLCKPQNKGGAFKSLFEVGSAIKLKRCCDSMSMLLTGIRDGSDSSLKIFIQVRLITACHWVYSSGWLSLSQ